MIYLDNNATTRPDPKSLNKSVELISNNYGNPSSIHQMGLIAKDFIENARSQVANSIGAKTNEVFFTSGGTEANNIALNVPSCPKNLIFGSNIEHSSVYNLIYNRIEVDENGHLDLDLLEERLRTARQVKRRVGEDKIIVAVMFANNETGVILDPYLKIRGICDRYNAFLHIDGVQGYKKEDPSKFNVGVLQPETLSLSAHKIHGLKGVGAVYIREDVQQHYSSIFKGGSHENGFRPGTENILGIVNMGIVASKSIDYKVKELRDYFESKFPEAEVNGDKENRLDNTSNLYFSMINDLELFLELLSTNGLMVSGQSACSSGMPAPSRVLKNMYGAMSNRLNGSIRVSFSEETTLEDTNKAIDIIKNVIKEIENG